MRDGVLIGALSLLFAALAVAPAHAQYDDDWRQRDILDSQLLPLDRVLPEVRRTHPGRFYDAEGPFQGADGQMHYRLKWMTPDGRVVWFDADARTGRVLGTGGGRHDFDREGPFDGPGADDRGGVENRRHDERRHEHFDDGDSGGPPEYGSGGGGDRNWSNDHERGWENGHERDWGGGPHFDRHHGH